MNLNQESVLALFAAWLRTQAAALGLFFGTLGLCAVFCWLYEALLAPLRDAALLCLACLIGWGAFGFARFVRRHRQLAALLPLPTLDAQDFPPAASLPEADYQALALELEQRRIAAVQEERRRGREQNDYYQLWAHQIKTPIAAMRLLLQSPAPDPGEVGVQLTRIEQYVQMALACQRLGSPTTDYVIRRCPLEPVARAQVRQLAPLFVHKRLSLEFAIPTDVTVLTDEKWLGFVLGQLLMNALQYTREGGVRLYLEPDTPLTLVIADSGCGIRPEDLPRVFEQGYTGLGGRQNQGSTGLGLHLCRQITDRLGHSLRLESDGPGQGTRALLGLASAVLEVE